jgi:transcriptional regulator with XRE-family HTH domain
MTNTEIRFKQNLIKLREKHGYTKYRVAKECKINYGYYSKLENPNENISPKFDVLEGIADFYCINVSDLFIENY